MKPQRKVDLLRKGWTSSEIGRAESILERKEKHDVFFSQIVFWSALLVIVFGNIIVSVILIPFLLFLKPMALYAIVVILALVVGSLYNFLITDIGHLEQKHHVLASILVPVIAAANLVIMVLAANKLGMMLTIAESRHNPWIISTIFAVVLLLPFLTVQIKNALEK